jgi:2-keto-4-pentenoate hydratase
MRSLDLQLTEADRERAASALAAAEHARTPIQPLTERWPALTVDDAYEIQVLNVRRRADAGATVKGHKVGLTAKAMQEMLGVDEPDYGVLLDDMLMSDDEVVDTSRFCAPRVEIEVAFILGARLVGPGCTAADVVAATDHVVPAIELIDSRIADWRITLADTIADNASSARVVLADAPTPPTRVDLASITGRLLLNDDVVETGSTSAVLGDPAAAVAWLANKVHEHGVALEAGEVVMPGSCTRAVDVHAGDVVRAEFEHLGSVSLRFS